MESSLFSDLRVLLAVLLFTILYRYFRPYNSRKVKLLKRFPGPKGLPILGNSLELVEPTEVLKNMTKWERAYGPRFLISFGTGAEVISLSEPNDLERVLTALVLQEKSPAYKSLKPWLGDGLLISSGEKLRSRRKMLTPAFHFQILHQYQQIFDEKTNDLANFVNEKLQDGRHFLEIHSLFTRSTLDIICETTMGKRLNCLRDPENLFLKATLRESQLMWRRWTSPWLALKFIWKMSPTGKEERANRKILDDFTNQVIQNRKSEFLKRVPGQNLQKPVAEKSDDENIYLSSTKKAGFLDLLLQHQTAGGDCAPLDEDIRDETATFMFAGHDTTASALTWTLYLLGLHPQHQKILCEEVDEVFGDDTTGREVSTKDLAKLKYLEMCIRESLRLFPPIPFITRKAAQDLELENGLVIPHGANVLVNIYQLHRRPDIYPDPLEYRPERFCPENISNRHPYAFIPFSAGPRNCIGQKFAFNMMKTALVNIFRNFTVKTVAPGMEDVVPIAEMVLRPSDGIHVQFRLRKLKFQSQHSPV